MAKVKSKCPNCGEISEIESSEFNVVCRFCGVPYMPREGIDNYNNHIANSIDVDTVNVRPDNISNYAMLGLASLKEKNAEKCGFYADDILKRDPINVEGLLLKAYFVSNNYSKEEGVRYFFLAFENCKNRELFSLIESTLFECFLDYSEENFNFLFKTLFAKEDIDKYFNILSYGLTMYFALYDGNSLDSAQSYLEDLHAELSLINSNSEKEILDIKSSKLLYNLNKEVSVLYRNENDELLLIGDLLLQIRLDNVISAVSLKYVNKEVGKYFNKSQDYKYSYYFHLNDNDMVELSFVDENKKLESLLTNKGFNISLVKGGCYIATCVYGSYVSKEVWTLRRFRDFKLKNSVFGRLFIKVYYFMSPTLVKWFGKTKWFNNINKNILDKLVNYLNTKGYEDIPYKE